MGSGPVFLIPFENCCLGQACTALFTAIFSLSLSIMAHGVKRKEEQRGLILCCAGGIVCMNSQGLFLHYFLRSQATVLQMISFPGGDSAFVHFHPPSIPLLHRFILPLFFQLQTALPRKYPYVLAAWVARSQRANFTADVLNQAHKGRILEEKKWC